MLEKSKTPTIIADASEKERNVVRKKHTRNAQYYRNPRQMIALIRTNHIRKNRATYTIQYSNTRTTPYLNACNNNIGN